ncbi:MAG: hypothetical protein ACPGSC_06910 [Granulosicoccaceae bacterium]
MARASDHNFLLALLRDHTFQAREIRRVLLFTTIYVALTTVLLGFFYHYMLGSMVAGVSPLMFVSEDMQQIDDGVPGMGAMLGKWLLLMLVINLVITLVAGIYIVRKLGAPIMALRRVIREIGEGNFAVKVRKDKDSEFSDVFNTLADSSANLRAQIERARDQLKVESDDPTELKRALERCRESLEYFKTQD